MSIVSASSDPYYVAREEVQKQITQLQEKAKRWEDMYLGNTAKAIGFSDLHRTLQKEVQSAEEDLRQIDGTVRAVEKNPARFPHCTPYELDQRRLWLSSNRAKLKTISDRISSPTVVAKLESDKRKNEADQLELDRVKRIAEKDNESKIEKTRNSHKQIMARQDQDLTELAKATTRLGEAAITINYELQDQARMLDDLDRDVERQMEKMNYVTRKTALLLKTSDTRQIYTIFVLTGLCVLLFLINIYF